MQFSYILVSFFFHFIVLLSLYLFEKPEDISVIGVQYTSSFINFNRLYQEPENIDEKLVKELLTDRKPAKTKILKHEKNKLDQSDLKQNIHAKNESSKQSKGTGKIDFPLIGSNLPPQYPLMARRLGYEGEVLLDVKVHKNGQVEQVKIKRSSGHKILDEAAKKAVLKWRWETKGQGAWIEQSIVFDLSESNGR